MTRRSPLHQAVSEIESLGDPAERATAAHHLLDALAEVRRTVSRIRHDAVVELRSKQGWSHQRVADILGVSKGTAQLIAEGRSRGSRTEQGRNGDAGDE